MKKALITGITGQDGSYLAELLLSKGYTVHGTVRREALEDPANRMWRLSHIIDRVTLHPLSLESYANIFALVDTIQPDECYHLAAQSFVSYSFDDEFATITTDVNSTHYLLSALNQRAPACRFYFAGSSELFGRARETPQKETTPFWPRSPYGVSKLAGYHLVRNYRETHGLFATCGIMYNHESPRRGFEFVTRKISSHVARIKLGRGRRIILGNLDAQRDWGHAKDYVKAMWRMLQQDNPDDYVICTGETHSVEQLLEVAFGSVGLSFQDYIEIDERLYRPCESVKLVGNSEKAQNQFGWYPTVSFEELVEEMVWNDVQLLKAD